MQTHKGGLGAEIFGSVAHSTDLAMGKEGSLQHLVESSINVHYSPSSDTMAVGYGWNETWMRLSFCLHPACWWQGKRECAFLGLLKCRILDTLHWKPKSGILLLTTMSINKMWVHLEHKFSEDKKILNFYSLCNIPVYLGHSMSFLIEFLPPFDMWWV